MSSKKNVNSEKNANSKKNTNPWLDLTITTWIVKVAVHFLSDNYKILVMVIIIRDLKQTDAAAEKRQSHSNLHSIKSDKC